MAQINLQEYKKRAIIVFNIHIIVIVFIYLFLKNSWMQMQIHALEKRKRTLLEVEVVTNVALVRLLCMVPTSDLFSSWYCHLLVLTFVLLILYVLFPQVIPLTSNWVYNASGGAKCCPSRAKKSFCSSWTLNFCFFWSLWSFQLGVFWG